MKTNASILTLLVGALAFSAASYSATYSPTRTGDGRPDFTGVWSNASVTNLTRSPGVTKLVVTRDEAEALVKANPFQRLIEAEDGPSDLKDDLLKDGNSDRGYNAFWIDPGNTMAVVKGEYRTSWIVEPANGQMPISPEGRKIIQADRAERQQALFHGPEALPLPERCLIGFSGAGGPGMLNTMYNNNYQFVQSPKAMTIVVEMVHDVRIIPIFKDKTEALAAHKPAAIKSWLGDSVGWWEGDTFVTHVVNVNPQQGRSGPIYLSDKGSVTERFTRVSPTQVLYEFEVNDPVYYSQTWRVEESLNLRKESIYEYACHEGNYAMDGILRGARNQEAQGIKPTTGPGIFGTPIPEKKK
jgi:urease gamma subunit